MKYRTMILFGVALLVVGGCAPKEDLKAKGEANKELVLQWWDLFYNKKDVPKAMELFAENAIYCNYGTGAVDTGRAIIQQKEEAFPKAFPDGKFRSEGIFSDGDYVILRWNADGTNTESLMGMPPTNKFVDVHGAQIFLIQNGKIQQVWDYWNMADFMKQMGLGS